MSCDSWSKHTKEILEGTSEAPKAQEPIREEFPECTAEQMMQRMREERAYVAGAASHNGQGPHHWLIFYEDAGLQQQCEIYTDEIAARMRHKNLSLNWNCHLFKQVNVALPAPPSEANGTQTFTLAEKLALSEEHIADCEKEIERLLKERE